MFALPKCRVIQRIDDGGHQAFDGSVQVVSQILGIIEVANTRATHEVRQHRMHIDDAVNDLSVHFGFKNNIVMDDVMNDVVMSTTSAHMAADMMSTTRLAIFVASMTNSSMDPVHLVFELVSSSVQVVNFDLRHC